MNDIPKLRSSINATVPPGLTARREPWYNNQWIVRDQDGTYRDHSQLRECLESRHVDLEVIE